MVSWREKCIDKFKLLPVPWHEDVGKGSEETWKNYYEFRIKWCPTLYDDDDDDADSDDDDDGSVELIKDWSAELDELRDELKVAKRWQATLGVVGLVWEDCEMIRSATFFSHIWSPYAIPQAVALEHKYHCRPRSTTVEFHVTWGYHLQTFLDRADNTDFKYRQLCSNAFEDEELRLDVINTFNFNKRTVDSLRLHLFGAVQLSQQDYCDDYSFLCLLFGSMGTFDFATIKTDGVGWMWSFGYSQTEQQLRERLVKEGVISEDSPGISWLEHAMRTAAGNLRPIDAYYAPPTLKDAMGYDSPEDENY